jgi:tetratricopeptide (TPR) repeat protein
MTRRVLLLTILATNSLLQVFAFQGKTQPPPAQADRGLNVRQVASGVAPDGKGQLWAVIVGISSYKNLPPEGQLRFAHRDAEELGAFLRSPRGGGFPSNHIKLLLNQDATLSAMRTAIGTWLVRSAEPDDVIYIFFAGHGVVEGETDGYLLAHDSDPQNLYATALQVSELDRIITQRLRARIVVLMADACHAGQLGWASRGTTTERALISNYLDEVGKSGAGVFRLLASRANERSFEDSRWGGGHGAFTHFMLEGLKGKGDRDKDGFVRVGELIDYLSAVVPEETRALQHPRFAGSVDARLPLSVLGTEGPRNAADAGNPVRTYSLEVRGTAGSEVYVDSAYRGKIRPNGVLVIEDLSPNRHEVSVDPPNAESFTQSILLVAAKTVLELKAGSTGPKTATATTMATAPPPTTAATTTTKPGAVSGPPRPKPMRESAPPVNSSSTVNNPPPVNKPPPVNNPPPVSSPLVARIKEAVARNRVLEPDGAWPLYRQLVRETPSEPQRASIEISLTSLLEEIGQQTINAYVRSSVLQLKASDFRRAADAFRYLLTLAPGDAQLETKQLFCEARVAIDEGKNQEAIAALNKAISLDPRAGHCYNALGVAYEKQKDNERAVEAFKRAAELAPQWSFPRLHLGIQYYDRRKMDRAEGEFETAVRLDPRDSYAGWWLVRVYRERTRYPEAETAALNLIRTLPEFASVHVELGQIYEAMRQYARAAAEFDTYLRLAPKAPDAMFIRYDVARIQEFAAKNRRLAENKQPTLKRP